MLIWATGTTGDESVQRHVIDAVGPRDGPFGTFVANVGIIGVPSEQRLEHAVDLIDEMPTAAGRGVMCANAAFLAQALGRLDVAAELADRALADNPEPNSWWVSAWTNKAHFHLAGGDLDEAVACASRVEYAARRLGEQSAFVPVLAIHALVLRQLERAEDCARVRGALPRKWALFVLRERDEMDAWLAEQLTTAELAVLAARGRATTLDQLLEIAPTALATDRP